MTLFLYSYYWWFDIPLHFVGGFCLASLTLWSFYPLILIGKRVPRRTTVLFMAVAGSFVFGVAWEIFEYFSGITFNTIGSYPLDTVKDLIVDMLGGYLAHVLVAIKNKRLTM
ncbi:MAG: hypothetical protein EXS46_01420 [Candidatus Taylorbacteria bacterium]|nr:hypothetical protein [Candidatus Taylorbacteria bacterium]